MRFHFRTRTYLISRIISSIFSESLYLNMLNDQYFDDGRSEKGKSGEIHLINGFRWSYDDFDHDETDLHLQIVPRIHKEEDDSKKDLLVVVPDEHSETGDNDDSDGSDNRSYLRTKYKKLKRHRIEISSDEESEGFTREVPSMIQKDLKRKRRRDKMSNKMLTLQQLLPNCHKKDKVSVLDKAIEYMRNLKLQLQVMSTMAMNPYFAPATLDFGMHYRLLTAMAIANGQNMTNQTTSSPLIPPLNWPLPPFNNLSLIPQKSGQSPFLPTSSLASSSQCHHSFVPYYSSFLNL